MPSLCNARKAVIMNSLRVSNDIDQKGMIFWLQSQIKGIIIIITPKKYFKLFIFFSNLFNNYIPDTTVIKYYSKNEILEILKIKNLNPIYFKSYSIIQGTLRKKLISERLFFVAQAWKQVV